MKVKIKTFWGGILGGEKTMVRRCRQGNLELTCATLASLAPTVPELSLMELPFLFSNDKQVDHMLDKVMLKKFKELLRQRGFIYWFWAENGWRNFATKSRLIKKPSDLKGLKMRAQENRIYINLYQVLGASPIPISVPEVLSSLQTGVVDGFDQTLMYSFTTSWYEGIKYFSLTRHIYQNVVCLISKKWADKVPKKVIDTILIGQYKDTLYSRSSLRKLRPLLRKNIAKAGIKIYQPSKKEIAAFRKASQPVYSMFRKDWGK